VTAETDELAREERAADELARAYSRLRGACIAVQNAVAQSRPGAEITNRRDELCAARLEVRRLVMTDEQLDTVVRLRMACASPWTREDRRRMVRVALDVIGDMIAVPVRS